MKVVEKILNGDSTREILLTETYDLLEMANVLGKYVVTDKIPFSFYFSDKIGMQHGIRVKIKWNRDKFTKPEDGYMELHGDYVFVSRGSHIPQKDINFARQFFKKYKVLFAAVWECELDPAEVQEFLAGRLKIEDILVLLNISDSSIKTLADLEVYVRKNNLFNMND